MTLAFAPSPTNFMINHENRTSGFNSQTRNAISMRTGFNLQLLFPHSLIDPGWSVDSASFASFQREYQRLESEFGESNVMGAVVYECSELNLALFVKDGARQKITT